MKSYGSKKRLSALAACVVLAGAVFLAACDSGGKSSRSSNGGNSAGSNNEASTPVKSALKFEYDDNLDLGKKTIKISTWGEPPKKGDNAYFDRRYTLAERTEKKYNVKFEWAPAAADTFTQDVTLAYSAGKKYADLIFCPSYYGFEIAQLGAIQPLDDFIDYASPHYALTGNNLKYVDGLHYSYMPDEVSVNSMGYFIVYNTTLTEAVLTPEEDPLALYEKGKWDWDAFANVAKKTTVIENGEAVQWGIGGSNLLDALCLSNGFSVVSMKDKKYECGLYTNAGMETLNFLRKLTFEQKSCDGQYGGHNSKAKFESVSLGMLVSTSYYPGTFISSGMPIKMVPMPKGPSVSKYVNCLEMQEWWAVSKISDFSAQELVQVALDMNENDPAYEDTYFSAEGRKENFVDRMYQGNIVNTEEEGEFFYDFIMDKNVDTILNITTSSIRSILAEKIYQPIAAGDDPRAVLDSMRSVINDSLNNMLPKRLK